MKKYGKTSLYSITVLVVVSLLSFVFLGGVIVNGQNLNTSDSLPAQQITSSVGVPNTIPPLQNIVGELPATIGLQLPTIITDTTYQILLPGRTIRNVRHDCTGFANCHTDLQPALDEAQPGDEAQKRQL
ncbi:hypothetical protein HYT53_01905 [Candidatus Woesearchaeota archaeon]|nr:hypothetical protein [Candidatus Woesearchaeota archaeon]